MHIIPYGRIDEQVVSADLVLMQGIHHGQRRGDGRKAHQNSRSIGRAARLGRDGGGLKNIYEWREFTNLTCANENWKQDVYLQFQHVTESVLELGSEPNRSFKIVSFIGY
jgi:hypothetical protein